MAGKAECETAGRERMSFLVCGGGAKSLASWFVGTGQMGEGRRLSKIGPGGDQLCGIRRRTGHLQLGEM